MSKHSSHYSNLDMPRENKPSASLQLDSKNKAQDCYNDDECDSILYNSVENNNPATIVDGPDVLSPKNVDFTPADELLTHLPQRQSSCDSTSSYVHHDRGTIFNQLGVHAHVVNGPPSPCGTPSSVTLEGEADGYLAPAVHGYQPQAQPLALHGSSAQKVHSLTKLAYEHLQRLPRSAARRATIHGIYGAYATQKIRNIVQGRTRQMD